MKRKIFAAVLAVVMLLSVFAVSASAAGQSFADSTGDFSYQVGFYPDGNQEALYCTPGCTESINKYIDLVNKAYELGLFGGCFPIAIELYFNNYGSGKTGDGITGLNVYCISGVASSYGSLIRPADTEKPGDITITMTASTEKYVMGAKNSAGNHTIFKYYLAYNGTWCVSSTIGTSIYTGCLINTSGLAGYYRMIAKWDNSQKKLVPWYHNTYGLYTLKSVSGSFCGLEHIIDMYNNLLTQWDQGYDSGYTAGYNAGVQTGGYDVGYEKGYEDAAAVYPSIQTMYYGLGKQACEETHAVLFEEARMEGKYEAFQQCEATHGGIYDDAYADGYQSGNTNGYADGYSYGYTVGSAVADSKLAEKYEQGITDALNTGNVILDYVDAVFSAPLNFLYNAFDIEILGINLFNIIMLILSIIIVGGVIYLVMKFR